jgi:hypothetical protein
MYTTLAPIAFCCLVLYDLDVLVGIKPLHFRFMPCNAMLDEIFMLPFTVGRTNNLLDEVFFSPN